MPVALNPELEVSAQVHVTAHHADARATRRGTGRRWQHAEDNCGQERQVEMSSRHELLQIHLMMVNRVATARPRRPEARGLAVNTYLPGASLRPPTRPLK